MAKDLLHQGSIFREPGILIHRDHLVYIRVSIQNARGPMVHEGIDSGIGISQPERAQKRCGKEDVSDMACGDQENALSREFHRETKNTDFILEYHEFASP
jgi:hypothetical protein